MITHSLIIAVLESYAMVELQARQLAKLLPATWELVLVDDGSVPEIPMPAVRPANFRMFRTREVRKPGEWTQKSALNRAVPWVSGEYIVKNDIDHVFTPEAIAAADSFRGDMMLFHRSAATISDALTIKPLPDHYVTSPIDDIYVLRKDLFFRLGGYPEYLTRRYGGGGSPFWEYSRKPEAQPRAGALIYVIPAPYRTYHDLQRVPESIPL